MNLMGYKLYSNRPIPCKFPTNKPNLRRKTIFSSSFSSSSSSSSFYSQNQVARVESQKPKPDTYAVTFKTLRSCKLGIARYPDFEYDAETGRGTGCAIKAMDGDLGTGEFSVSFDLETLYIPPLKSSTTKFLGLPLPPLLKIDILPEFFRGIINRESGKVDLEFKAKFLFSVGSIYRAPPLLVRTVLTSEESRGTVRSGRGERLDEEGRCRLVGVAIVDPIDDLLLNSFLGLPTECIAELNAVILFSG